MTTEKEAPAAPEKFTKSIRRLYLAPDTIVDVNEGQPVPKALFQYRNKLAAVGAVKAAPPAAPAPSKPSKKKESK